MADDGDIAQGRESMAFDMNSYDELEGFDLNRFSHVKQEVSEILRMVSAADSSEKSSPEETLQSLSNLSHGLSLLTALWQNDDYREILQASQFDLKLTVITRHINGASFALEEALKETLEHGNREQISLAKEHTNDCYLFIKTLMDGSAIEEFLLTDELLETATPRFPRDIAIFPNPSSTRQLTASAFDDKDLMMPEPKGDSKTPQSPNKSFVDTAHAEYLPAEVVGMIKDNSADALGAFSSLDEDAKQMVVIVMQMDEPNWQPKQLGQHTPDTLTQAAGASHDGAGAPDRTGQITR